LLLAVCTSLLFAASAGAAPGTWYASPGGTGTACSQVAPCAYAYAVGTKASSTDTVVLAGGNYAIDSNTQITKWISIEGAKTGVPTRLIGGPATAATLYYTGAASTEPAHITDVQATNQKINGAAIYVNGSSTGAMDLDRVYGETSGNNSVGIWAIQSSSTGLVSLRDSVGRSTGSNSLAVRVTGPTSGSGSADLRNVVGDARGTSGSGISLEGGQIPMFLCANLVVTMKNSYARSAAGPASDLNAVSGVGGGPPCTTTVNSTNSNWRSSTGTAIINSSGDQHSVDALFVDAAAGDYHQLAASPTIDAGVADAKNGPQDIDREARAQGKAPDIGADEFNSDVVAPVGSKLKLTPKSFRPKSGKSASIAAAKKKKPKGTKVTFTLSEAATVTFTVERKASGRKKGSKCVAKRKTGKKCTIYKALKGSFARPGVAGANAAFKFTGHLNGKALKPGSYRLVGTPTDAAGNVGAAFRASFSILKR
jgi:hypothetical protein